MAPVNISREYSDKSALFLEREHRLYDIGALIRDLRDRVEKLEEITGHLTPPGEFQQLVSDTVEDSKDVLLGLEEND